MKITQALSFMFLVALSPILVAQDRLLERDDTSLTGKTQLAECPVEINGLRVVLNKADRAVLSLRGTHDQVLRDGSVHTSRWTMNYSTFLRSEDGLQPGAEMPLPGGKKYFNVQVTGVVLDNGTLWGPEAIRLKADCKDRAITMRYQLREMLDLAKKYPRDSMIALLANREPVQPGQIGELLHMYLRGALYDREAHDLKEDPVVFLTRILDHLETF